MKIKLSLYLSIFSLPVAHAFQPQDIKDCLPATVCITVTKNFDQGTSYGSGFIANENGHSYVYTNAHVVDNAKKIDIISRDGSKITDIVEVQTFTDSFGAIPDFISGDCVRFKLRDKRTVALSIASDFSSIDSGSSITVLGDNEGANDGRQEIEILGGRITERDSGVLKYDCGTKPGSSGGAIIDNHTLQVIGINTYGTIKPSKDPFESMIGENSEFLRGGGVLLQKPAWATYSTSEYFAMGRTVGEFLLNLEVMVLNSFIQPRGYGLFADFKEQFVANKTVGDALREHENHPIMKEWFELINKIEPGQNGKGSTRIPQSNQQVYRRYYNSLKRVLAIYKSSKEKIDKAELSDYYQSNLDHRLSLQGAEFYARNLEETMDWFQDKTSAGGRNLIGRWERIPALGAVLRQEVREILLNKR